jgi:hypothetical protein
LYLPAAASRRVIAITNIRIFPRCAALSAYAADMAHGDTTLLTERPEAADALLDVEPDAALPNGLVASLKSFAAAHDGAKAIIEYVGRRGARIVLVGEDGDWGDQFAPSTDLARHACATAGVPVENSWERELIEQMRPTRDLWRSMARRSLAR